MRSRRTTSTQSYSSLTTTIEKPLVSLHLHNHLIHTLASKNQLTTILNHKPKLNLIQLYQKLKSNQNQSSSQISSIQKQNHKSNPRSSPLIRSRSYSHSLNKSQVLRSNQPNNEPPQQAGRSQSIELSETQSQYPPIQSSSKSNQLQQHTPSQSIEIQQPKVKLVGKIRAKMTSILVMRMLQYDERKHQDPVQLLSDDKQSSLEDFLEKQRQKEQLKEHSPEQLDKKIKSLKKLLHHKQFSASIALHQADQGIIRLLSMLNSPIFKFTTHFYGFELWRVQFRQNNPSKPNVWVQFLSEGSKNICLQFEIFGNEMDSDVDIKTIWPLVLRKWLNVLDNQSLQLYLDMQPKLELNPFIEQNKKQQLSEQDKKSIGQLYYLFCKLYKEVWIKQSKLNGSVFVAGKQRRRIVGQKLGKSADCRVIVRRLKEHVRRTYKNLQEMRLYRGHMLIVLQNGSRGMSIYVQQIQSGDWLKLEEREIGEKQSVEDLEIDLVNRRSTFVKQLVEERRGVVYSVSVLERRRVRVRVVDAGQEYKDELFKQNYYEARGYDNYQIYLKSMNVVTYNPAKKYRKLMQQF